MCIKNLDKLNQLQGKECPWNFCFELETHERSFFLFARSAEERDLWVNGFHDLMGIPVHDSNFMPIM